MHQPLHFTNHNIFEILKINLNFYIKLKLSRTYDVKKKNLLKSSRKLILKIIRHSLLLQFSFCWGGKTWTKYNLKLAGSCSIFYWHQSLCVQSLDNSAGFTKKAFASVRKGISHPSCEWLICRACASGPDSLSLGFVLSFQTWEDQSWDGMPNDTEATGEAPTAPNR